MDLPDETTINWFSSDRVGRSEVPHGVTQFFFLSFLPPWFPSFCPFLSKSCVMTCISCLHSNSNCTIYSIYVRCVSKMSPLKTARFSTGCIPLRPKRLFHPGFQLIHALAHLKVIGNSRANSEVTSLGEFL